MLPAQGQVDVWVIALDESAHADWDVLDAHEQARALRLRSATDRARFVTAHAAVRHILAGYLGAQPGAVELVRGPAGKPAVAGHPFHFSASRSVACALLAVADRPVGVDVECIREELWSRSFARAQFGTEATGLSANELCRMWTRREAIAKLSGEGIAARPMEPHPAARVFDLAVPSGYVGTLAVSEPADDVIVTSRDATRRDRDGHQPGR